MYKQKKQINIKGIEFMNSKLIGTGLLTGFTAVFGGWHITLQILLILMLSDIISGIIKGTMTTGVASRELRQGLVTKASFFLVIVLAYQIDLLMGNASPIVRTAVVSFYIVVEGVSIVENLGVIGVPIPKIVSSKLKQFKDALDNEEDSETESKIEK